MINKYKSEIKPNINMTTSTIVTESKTYTRTTTTMTTSGGYTKTEIHSSTGPGISTISSNLPAIPNILSTGSSLSPNSVPPFSRQAVDRWSYHPPSTTAPYTSITPYRSAFNNQPIAAYRSFNTKTSFTNNAEKPPDEKKKKSGILSIFTTSEKEKKEKEKLKKAQEEAKAMKEREKQQKEAKEKEAKEKEKEAKEREKREKEAKEKERKAKKLQEKDQKDNKSITGYDARQITTNVNNGYSSNNSRYINLGDMDKKLVIKVVKTRKFYPIEADKIPTYKTDSKYSRGRVLLINNINFRTKFRYGAEVDHANISKLCTDMGFKVKGYTDKSKYAMEKIITDYCKDPSLKHADINITIIMSHGNGEDNNTYIETIDNQLISIEWIVNQFSNEKCLYLANKPKIFIFQCCRGEDRDIVTKGTRQLQTDAVSFQAPRNNADMLLTYATVPGFVSHRDPKLGTWYIQSICKIFMEHAHDTDVENLLKIVDENLEKTYLTHRQTSSYENRGFKRCFLNPI